MVLRIETHDTGGAPDAIVYIESHPAERVPSRLVRLTGVRDAEAEVRRILGEGPIDLVTVRSPARDGMKLRVMSETPTWDFTGEPAWCGRVQCRMPKEDDDPSAYIDLHGQTLVVSVGRNGALGALTLWEQAAVQLTFNKHSPFPVVRLVDAQGHLLPPI